MQALEQRHRPFVLTAWVPKLENGPAPISTADFDDDVGSLVVGTTAVAYDVHHERRTGCGGGLGRVRVARVLRVQVRIAIEPVDLVLRSSARRRIDSEPADQLGIERDRAASR